MEVGLVLSGGMAKGAYQVGALKALNRFLPLDEIRQISCSSIGVLNGFSFATGHLDLAEMMWKSCCKNGTKLFITQVLKSNILPHYIQDLLRHRCKLDSDLFASLYDAKHREIVYKNLNSVEDGRISDYLRASISMPIYNKPMRLNNCTYYDGAMIDNIPVYPLYQKKLDYIICIYFDDVNYKFEDNEFDSKIVKITFPSDSFIKKSLIVDQEHVNQMMGIGYDRTSYLLEQVYANGSDLDSIYESIDRVNNIKDYKLRVTGDVIMTNINRAAQKFAKRKVEF